MVSGISQDLCTRQVHAALIFQVITDSGSCASSLSLRIPYETPMGYRVVSARRNATAVPIFLIVFLEASSVERIQWWVI